MKNLIVRIHKNKYLSKIVQQLGFDDGRNWSCTGAVHDTQTDSYEFIYFHLDELLRGDSTPRIESGLYAGYPIFDAATEMGKIVEFLAAPEKKLKIETLAHEGNGSRKRDGIISENGKVLTVGCSTISFCKVKETYFAMIEAQT